MTCNTVHSQFDDRERDKGMTHPGHHTPKLSVSQVKESVQFVCVCVNADDAIHGLSFQLQFKGPCPHFIYYYLT